MLDNREYSTNLPIVSISVFIYPIWELCLKTHRNNHCLFIYMLELSVFGKHCFYAFSINTIILGL
jgi:hypothetical protein